MVLENFGQCCSVPVCFSVPQRGRFQMLPPPPPPRLLREGAAGCSDWLKCEAWVEDLRGTLSSGMSSPHAAASAAAGDRVRGGARAPPPLPPPPLPRGPTAWARLPSCMGSRSVPSCSAESSWCAAASNSSGVISMASCISREAARTNSGSQYLPKPWSLSTCNQDAKNTLHIRHINFSESNN